MNSQEDMHATVMERVWIQDGVFFAWISTTFPEQKGSIRASGGPFPAAVPSDSVNGELCGADRVPGK